jgi:hypothetical protein
VAKEDKEFWETVDLGALVQWRVLKSQMKFWGERDPSFVFVMIKFND